MRCPLKGTYFTTVIIAIVTGNVSELVYLMPPHKFCELGGQL